MIAIALVAGGVASAVAGDVTVEAGGETFVVQERDGMLFRAVGKNRQRVFARTLRVQTPECSGQAFPDGRTAKLSVKEVFPAYTIVRGE